MDNTFDNEIWECLLDQCRNGNVQAMRLYWDLRKQNEGEGAKMAPVVIIDDIRQRLEERRAKQEGGENLGNSGAKRRK